MVVSSAPVVSLACFIVACHGNCFILGYKLCNKECSSCINCVFLTIQTIPIYTTEEDKKKEYVIEYLTLKHIGCMDPTYYKYIESWASERLSEC